MDLTKTDYVEDGRVGVSCSQETKSSEQQWEHCIVWSRPALQTRHLFSLLLQLMSQILKGQIEVKVLKNVLQGEKCATVRASVQEINNEPFLVTGPVITQRTLKVC